MEGLFSLCVDKLYFSNFDNFKGHNPVMYRRIWQIFENNRGLLDIKLLYEFGKYRIRNECSVDIKAKQEVGHFVVVVQS